MSSILTCGKSITILTILEKQSVLFPGKYSILKLISHDKCPLYYFAFDCSGYKSAFTPIQDIVAPTELYDNFLSNLRKNLVMHKRKTVHEKKFKPNIPLVVEGLSLQDLIGDVSEYDSDLVAAYDIIAADLPQVVFSNQDEENIVEEQGLFIYLKKVKIYSNLDLRNGIKLVFPAQPFNFRIAFCCRRLHQSKRI